MSGRGNPSSGRQVSDLTPPMTANESAPDTTAGEGCVPCGTCGGDQTRGWHLHDRPATPDADDASDHALGHPSLADCDGDALGPGEVCGRPDASVALTQAERETMTALRREIGPPTNHDHRWQPMVAASEVRTLLDCIDRLVREAAAATKARADERERIAQAIEAAAEGLYPHARRDFATAARIARGDA